jgi:hypothetical protein
MAGLWVIPLVGVFFLVRKPEPSTGKAVDRRIDLLGAFLFTAGFILLFLSLSQSVTEDRGWNTPCKHAMRNAPAVRN